MFAEWSGCSMVLCLVLVFRCARVVVYVMGCYVCCNPALLESPWNEGKKKIVNDKYSMRMWYAI